MSLDNLLTKERAIEVVEALIDEYKTRIRQDPELLLNVYRFTWGRPIELSQEQAIQNIDQVVNYLDGEREEIVSSIRDLESEDPDDLLVLLYNSFHLPGDGIDYVMPQFPELSEGISRIQEMISLYADDITSNNDLQKLWDFRQMQNRYFQIPGVFEISNDLGERLRTSDFVFPFLHREDFSVEINTRFRQIGKPKSQIEEELNAAVTNFHNNLPGYINFLLKHPELRGVGDSHSQEQSRADFKNAYPFLNGLFTFGQDVNSSAQTYWNALDLIYLGQRNIGFYQRFEEELGSIDPNIGIIFERDLYGSPAEMLLYLLPYGEKAQEIEPFLESLRHGKIIGFGSLATAEIEGERYIDLETFQTDLLRKDRFENGRMVKNEDNSYTVPARLRRPYLDGYDFAKRIISAVETAGRRISEEHGLAGMVIPDWSTVLDQRSGGMGDFKLAERDGTSGFIKQLYTKVPLDMGFKDPAELEINFPLRMEIRKALYFVKTFK
ncbi:MAG: hypothetical protein IH934_03605 [Nanoarchaeota archaeon]|nr:hypothetical protein [Nanoarchaeota archaeon]